MQFHFFRPCLDYSLGIFPGEVYTLGIQRKKASDEPDRLALYRTVDKEEILEFFVKKLDYQQHWVSRIYKIPG